MYVNDRYGWLSTSFIPEVIREKKTFIQTQQDERKHSAYGHKTFVNHCLKGGNA